MQRDRNQTERRLIDAVGDLISQDGLAGVGINRVARQSGVNKVLIYRYFGGLGGLLDAYRQRNQARLAGSPVLPLKTNPDVFSQFHTALTKGVKQLQHNPETQAILRAELCNPAPNLSRQLTASLYQPLADALAGLVGAPVGQAYAALLVNGLVLLSLQQPAIHPETGLPVHDSWEQVEAAVQLIFQGTSRLLADGQRADH